MIDGASRFGRGGLMQRQDMNALLNATEGDSRQIEDEGWARLLKDCQLNSSGLDRRGLHRLYNLRGALRLNVNKYEHLHSNILLNSNVTLQERTWLVTMTVSFRPTSTPTTL